MPSLSEVFTRSSLRRGADHSINLPVAFEVEDLTIPTGTVWSEAGERYLLGSVEVPRARGLIMVLYLELAAFPGAGDQIHLHGSTESLGVAYNSTNLWNHAVIGGSSNTDLTPFPDASDPWTAEAWLEARNDDDNNLETIADVEIVRARASFQIL